jgi:uncharacterized membrane protein
MNNLNPMKPINIIIFSVASLLLIAVVIMIFGWSTQAGVFLSVSKIMFVVAFAFSCIPLIALGTFELFTKVKSLFFRDIKVRNLNPPSHGNQKRPPPK